MCGVISPAVAAWVSVATAVASTAVSVYSNVQQGKRADELAEYNAKLAENEAQDARNLATEKENTHRTKVAQLLSKQRATLGASNVDINSGSALQLQQDTTTLGEVDALRIRATGDKTVESYESQAELNRLQGETAETQSYLNATGSFLSGASKVVDIGVSDKWKTSSLSA